MSTSLFFLSYSANGDNRMDVDDTNQGLPHIPGVDDTTLLSNVSDEFVLPPILTTGKNPIDDS